MSLTLDRIAARQSTVGIIGLGYVGLPLALVFSEAGFPVLGFDIDQSKIDQLAQGKTYIRHIVPERIASATKRGFAATTSFARADQCDALIICVPTPLDHHLIPDLRFVEDTCRAIAPHIASHTLVVLESTTWPGTTIEVVKPILEQTGRVALDRDLYLCFSPEREDPGNASFSTKSIPKLVGGANRASLELGLTLYGAALDQVIAVESTQIAEAAKLLENIFRCVNIALVNELKIIFDRMDIDVWKVIQAASTKPFGYMPFFPGPGLGGHCIPIDPFYLAWKAKEFGLNTRFIELAGEINRAMPAWVVAKVQDCLNDHGKALKGSRVLLLGMAYKGDIDDIRESPSLELIELLEGKGARVDYHDPYVPVVPSTRQHGKLAGRVSKPLSRDYDCFLIATAHKIFDAQAILAHGVPVIDTRNCCPRQAGVYPA